MTDGIAWGFGIETRYHGATNYKPSRVSARLTDAKDREFGPVWVSYDDALDARDAHEKAARKLLNAWVASYPYTAEGRIIAACGSDRGYIFFADTRKADV